VERKVKGSVAILICDGQPDSQGCSYKPEGVTLPKGEVPVTLEFDRTSFAAYVGKAKLRMDGGIIYADLNLLDVRLPEPAPQVLYPAAGGASSTAKFIITDVGLSVHRNVDHRIGTLAQQGIKP
jgi:hypothetical protein